MSPESKDSMSVLHVDDDPEFLEVTENFLEREDEQFEIVTATSVERGLEVLSERDIDCIVSDYDMPKMDGIEFLRSVRDRNEDLPFILLTGKGSEEIASQAISAGVTDYLQKMNVSSQYTVLANRISNSVSRYQASKQVQDMKTWFRKLLSESTDFIFTVNENGQIQYATPSVKRVLGFSPEELIDTDAFDLIHPDDTEKASAEFASILDAPGNEATTEFRAQYKEGAWRWLEVRGRNLLDDPIVQSIAVNVRDITARKKQIQGLELYESMLETVPDGVYALDENLEYLEVNQGLADLTGYSRQELVESHLSILHDEDGIQTAVDKRRQLFQSDDSNEVRIIEQTYQTKDGREIPCEVRFRSLNTNNNIRGTAGVVRDISDRKEREQKLQKLSEEYEALLEHADDDIFLINVESVDADYEFRFERLSPSHESTSGLTTDEIRGKTPKDLLGEEIGTDVESNYRECVESREVITYEEELPMPEGNIIWHTKLAPVIVDGDVKRIVGIARDMTERWEREQELQRKNERLDEFASVISHELRSPLSVGQGRLQLVQETASEELTENLDKIANSLDRMESILEDTLTLARQGETVKQTEPIDIEPVIRRCWNVVESNNANLELVDEFTLEADRDRLRHIIENLIRNAVEHGRDDVTIHVGRHATDGFYIEDDGPGIPADKRDQVFEAGHSTRDDGTGFGLTLVKRIAEAHGWDISITKGQEGGARFEFSNVDIGK